ncbi:PREDICTED: uncharacterized protein LOC109230052 [Nicotiana attenuata]|uniref:uncharacterized protein LOC109230052 n=1 Tax=Nicotiana attenuata TaxID=49451 RepID=UPI0009046F55|nr:PREDICTED: uncharacterized protein LOC109230052 [Nicotiana attenuata]
MLSYRKEYSGSQEKRLTELRQFALTEECTSKGPKIKLPQKLKDPGSFTIPVRIGNIDVGLALLQWVWTPRPTTVMLQLADRSIAHHDGVIEDVLLQIGKFILPC